MVREDYVAREAEMTNAYNFGKKHKRRDYLKEIEVVLGIILR
jgi:hypothetical protein